MRRITTAAWVLAILTGFLSLPLSGQGLPTAEPHEVGLSAERLVRLRTVLQSRIDIGEMAGVVTLIGRQGKVAHFEALGHMDREAGKPMRRHAIFRIALMTKPWCYDEGVTK